MKTSFISLKRLFNTIRPDNAMVSLGNSFELPVLFRNLGWRVISAAMPGKVKVPRRMHQLAYFSKYLLQMRKHHGATTVVKYLKACQLAVQKQIARDRIESLRDLVPDLPLPRLTSSSLPRIIPLRDRRAICAGSSNNIRFWLTVFSVYRVLTIPGSISLSTITEQFTGDPSFLEGVDREIRAIALTNLSKFPKIAGSGCKLLLTETSSPSSKSSWLGFVTDVRDILSLGMSDRFKFFLDFYQAKDLKRVFVACETLSTSPLSGYTGQKTHDQLMSGRIGQLSVKEEAAGKVRVFALVDIWTQSILKPLHNALFSFLRSVPNDATFDQHCAVLRARDKVSASGKSFGYDLSAATDRLPVSLQASLLSAIYGEEFGSNWKSLLVDREYRFQVGPKSPYYGDNGMYKYSVGQPMGALSSWAMLAITHHFLVQLAARRAGLSRAGKWFENYELLGDDIVIFDSLVAQQYLTIMAGIGVPINTSKSVIAKNATFEFAKVTFHKGSNVSAISWKMFISQNTLMGRANIAFSLLKKDITSNRLVSWVDKYISHTRGESGVLAYSYFAILTMASNSKLMHLEKLLSVVTPSGKPTYTSLLSSLNLEELKALFSKVFLKKESPEMYESDDMSYHMYLLSFKQHLRARATKFVSAFKKEDFILSVVKSMMIALPFNSEVVIPRPNYKPTIIPYSKAWQNRNILMSMNPTLTAINTIFHYLLKLVDNELARPYERIFKSIYASSGAHKEILYKEETKSSMSPFVFPHLASSGVVPPPYKPSSYAMMSNPDEPLLTLIKVNDEIDRVNEIAAIVKRATVKASDGVTSKEVKDSPLSILSFMARALKASSRLSVIGAVTKSKTALKLIKNRSKAVPIDIPKVSKPEIKKTKKPFVKGGAMASMLNF